MNAGEVAKWSVLIVDDEHDNLEVVAETLGFFGASVKTAKDGLDALEVMKTFTPTLILLDLAMPNMDGWAMQRYLKEHPETSQIPVVAVTAHAMHTDKDKVYEVGFDGYLTKPVNVPTLFRDIMGALEEGKRKKAELTPETPKEAAVPPAAVEPVVPEVSETTPKQEMEPVAAEVLPEPAQTDKPQEEGIDDTKPAEPAEERSTTEAVAVQSESVVEAPNAVQSKENGMT